jgi:hypothetical protein
VRAPRITSSSRVRTSHSGAPHSAWLDGSNSVKPCVKKQRAVCSVGMCVCWRVHIWLTQGTRRASCRPHGSLGPSEMAYLAGGGFFGGRRQHVHQPYVHITSTQRHASASSAPSAAVADHALGNQGCVLPAKAKRRAACVVSDCLAATCNPCSDGHNRTPSRSAPLSPHLDA